MSRSGILPRILQSWWSPGQVVVSLRGVPDRGLVVVLMAAMLIFLIAQAPVHQRAAYLDPSVPFQARMGGALLAVMFIMPLLAYALAALVSVLSRLTPWPVAPRDSRLALFWALLAVAPAMLLSGLTAGLIGPGPALSLTQAAAGIGFLVIWAAGLRATAQPQRR
ncbi:MULTISPECIES: hypothetical protein [unclassified Paracoccus (in: a-proteobacteria)]|uniref:hypothetical protein n=1 Tax=unclassified Paracoccus (in: a-proteobacteria) TaxID=2688777 RepID=UPI0012B25968|nr:MULTISPECIES: hypothetical protein [unclassified Paracoccus (in: a-proteobacteria)]UXU74091.1 hypothetical protein GB879_009200 [Paracoccus sp. SMMA_5]UXU79981.1 hypothetical protein GB880_009180 [Paracoccus sp. SMMA_5_TC]